MIESLNKIDISHTIRLVLSSNIPEPMQVSVGLEHRKLPVSPVHKIISLES